MTRYTTDEVREKFTETSSRNPYLPEVLGEGFDRWLADHDAEVAAGALYDYSDALSENPSSGSWPSSAIPGDIEDWIKFHYPNASKHAEVVTQPKENE